MAPPPHKDYSLNHSQIYLSGLSHVWESCLDPEELSNHQSLKSLPHKVSRLQLVPAWGTWNTNDVKPELLERELRLAYETSYFYQTQLCILIQDWQKIKSYYQILK